MENAAVNIFLIVVTLVMIVFRMFMAAGAKSINFKQFHYLLVKNPHHILIDLREPQEFSKSRIPGAKNIPFDSLLARIGEIDQGKPVFLYDRNGSVSHQAGKVLLRKGYRVLFRLRGGFKAWEGPQTTDAPVPGESR